MMMNRMNARESRVVAVGLLAVVLILVTFGIVKPYVARYDHYAEAIDEQKFRLQRLIKAKRRLPLLQQQIAALRDYHDKEGLLLEQGTPALAAAQIQQQVAGLVATAGGQITSTQVGRVRDEDGFSRVSVSVRMTGSVEVIAELFAEIETSKPLLFIDDVNVTATQARIRRNANRGDDQDAAPVVRADFELYAYMRTPGAR